MVSRAAVVKGIPGTRYMMALMIITSPLTLKGQSSWMSIAEKATTNPQKAVVLKSLSRRIFVNRSAAAIQIPTRTEVERSRKFPP